MRIICLLTLALSTAAFAQKYDFGLNGGISFYGNKTVTNPRGDAKAGFKPGWVAGFSIGHDMYEHAGGEIRYTFLQNAMKLESGSTKASFGAQAHLIHYDFLLHTAKRSASVRPYIAFGGGAKIYRGTGEEQPFQPLSNTALLTKTTDTRPMVSAGGGVKAKLSDRVWLRFDVHDYLTSFPKNVIAPAAGSEVGGWIHNIVGTGGISFTF